MRKRLIITLEPRLDPVYETRVDTTFTTLEIQRTLSKFLMSHYRGIINIKEGEIENRTVVFNGYDLAFLIKCVLYEIAIMWIMCDVYFEADEGEFRIFFRPHSNNMPSAAALEHLRGAAVEFHLPLYTTESEIIIGVPTKKAPIKVYNKSPNKFEQLLYEVFSDVLGLPENSVKLSPEIFDGYESD